MPLVAARPRPHRLRVLNPRGSEAGPRSGSVRWNRFGCDGAGTAGCGETTPERAGKPARPGPYSLRRKCCRSRCSRSKRGQQDEAEQDHAYYGEGDKQSP